MPDEPLLSVRDLEKHYPITEGVLRREVGRVRAVDGISFDVHRGETLGLIGETGCGKSTAARALLRLEEPTAGTVRFDGEPVTSFGKRALVRFRRRAQLVLQDPTSSFDPRMTVGASVAEPLRAHGLADRDERRRRVEAVLERVGLEAGTAGRYPHELSGGQRQRAALARALVLNPSLLVADEPVSALDVSVQAEILTLLEDLQREFDLAVLLITHDMNVVREVADRVAVMYLGELVEVGPTGALLEAPQHPYTRALVDAIPSLDPGERGRRQPLSGDVPDPANPPAGCRFHTRCPEVIPPERFDLDGPAWRALVDLRARLAEATRGDGAADAVAAALDGMADEGPRVDPGTLREAFDLPARLDDPAAEDVLATALDLLADGDLAAAEATLGEGFSTPCVGEDPSLRETPAGHPAACHLHEPST